MQSEYDFDEIIDRRSTGSYKWRMTEQEDIIPLGVADMDFRSPPPVLDALHARVEHGVFGYTRPSKGLMRTIQETILAQYDWQVEEDWLVWLPGLVSALNAACRATCEQGESALTTTPIYPPFLSAPKNMSRALHTAPMDQDGDTWRFDFDQLSEAITPDTRLFMLCNPHNPIGRVYEREELAQIGEFCLEHDLVICSDEIHCGLILDEHKSHFPLSKVLPDSQGRIITLMSPSKTFNLAGIGVGFAIIPGESLRRAFTRATAGLVPGVSALGYVAAEAAYKHGEPWRQALLEYLRGNRELVERTIAQIPGISMCHVEGTYLAWIDVRPTGIESPGESFQRAGVLLWDGADFGEDGFVRLNFACSREQLRTGLERIQAACQNGEGG
jgi:cystathionine beta-lyase